MGCERCEAHSRVYTSTLTVTSSMPRPSPKKIFPAASREAPATDFYHLTLPLRPAPNVPRRDAVTGFVTGGLPRFVTVKRVRRPAARPRRSNPRAGRTPLGMGKIRRRERALLKKP